MEQDHIWRLCSLFKPIEPHRLHTYLLQFPLMVIITIIKTLNMFLIDHWYAVYVIRRRCQVVQRKIYLGCLDATCLFACTLTTTLNVFVASSGHLEHIFLVDKDRRVV